MVGGREIGSALFNNGGTLGLDVDPSDARSVLILGGRRGPDVPGRSHNVCLLSTSLAAEVVCGSSRRGVGRGKDDSAGCGEDVGGNVGVAEACAGTGCVAFRGGFDGVGRVGGEDFSGKNAGAFGLNEILEGKGVVSERGGRDWGGSKTATGGERVNEGFGFVAGEES